MAPKNKGSGPLVIVRSNLSGVTAGRLVTLDASWIELLEARRIYDWTGAETVSGIATDGVKPGPGTHVDKACPGLFRLRISEGDEVIVLSDRAWESI